MDAPNVKARLYNRIWIAAAWGIAGVAGGAVLYYSVFFVMALVNYFDNSYKHGEFYDLYPTAISYLITFFSAGTLKHLPGYEIVFNLGIPLALGCGVFCLGILLAILMRNSFLEIGEDRICGKGILGKAFDLPVADLKSAKPCLLHGMVLGFEKKRYLFLCIKNRDEILMAFSEANTTV